MRNIPLDLTRHACKQIDDVMKRTLSLSEQHDYDQAIAIAVVGHMLDALGTLLAGRGYDEEWARLDITQRAFVTACFMRTTLGKQLEATDTPELAAATKALRDALYTGVIN